MTRALLSALDRLRARLRPTAPAEASDGDLLGRYARSRDGEAFAALMHRHGPMILGVCRRLLGDVNAAEDVFQATFLVLARRAGKLDRTGSVAGWLHAVARHAALRARAAAGRRRDREGRVVSKPPEQPDTRVQWAELRPILDEELGRLPTAYREVVVLCYLEGRSNDEAAARLGCPLGTVKSRLARGRDLLRARLTRRGLTLTAAGVAALLTTNSLCAAVPAALTTAALSVVAGVGSSPTAVTLAEGVLRMFFVHRLKWALGAVFAASLVLTLGARLLLTAPASEPEVVVLAPLAAPDEAPRAEGPIDHFSLVNVVARDLDKAADEPPALRVGQVPRGQEEAILRAAEDGTLELQPAKAETAVGLVVVSPHVASIDLFRLFALTRQGRDLTLTTESWTYVGAERARMQLRATRRGFVIPLGVLEPGEYRLRFARREFEQQQRLDGPFQLTAQKEAVLKFTVAAKDGAPEKAPVLLKQDAFEAVAVPAAERERLWCRPEVQVVHLGWDEKSNLADVLAVAKLRVGTFAKGRLPGATRKTLSETARPIPLSAKDDVCYAVQAMDGSDFGAASIRSLEWKDGELVVHADLWSRFPTSRRHEEGASWLEVVMQIPNPGGAGLDPVKLKQPGRYPIRVEWTVWKSNVTHDQYQPNPELYQPLPDDGKESQKRLIGSVGEGSRATIRLP